MVITRWSPGHHGNPGEIPEESVLESMSLFSLFVKYFSEILSIYLYGLTIYDVNTYLYRSTIDISVVVEFVGYCITTYFLTLSIKINGSTILRLHPNQGHVSLRAPQYRFILSGFLWLQYKQPSVWSQTPKLLQS